MARQSVFPRPTCPGSLWVAVVATLLSLAGLPEVKAATPVPVPAVEPAPDIGEMWNEAPLNLPLHGFVEEEFFFAGTTSEGDYKSRMIVRRPADRDRFNGTVIVEWMNASSGSDIDVDFLSLWPLMVREGYAYVAVTAQQVTVNFLKDRNPDRYGTLEMTDDIAAGQPAAFEVFSQAGQALVYGGTGTDPLDGLWAERLIAIGQSQSSGRLTTYVDTIHGIELDPVFDAFVPHAGGPAPTRFPVPVFKINSENEAPGYYDERGVSDPYYRYWEIPGTAHQPLAGTRYAIDLLTAARGFFPTCPFPYQGPGGPVPIDPVLRAAISHLDHWIRTGVAPPDAPLIEMEPSPTNPSLGVIQRDAFGNALGGIRMPQQDVPTGRNSPSFGCKIQHPVVGEIVLATFPQWDAFDGGDDPAVDDTDLWNDTEPDSPHDLYGNHGQYVSRFVRAVRAVERDGYILNFDARRLRRGAASSDIGKEPTQTPEADDNDLPAPARTRSRRPSSAGSERTPAGPEHRGPPKLPPQANAAAGNRGNGRGNAD